MLLYWSRWALVPVPQLLWHCCPPPSSSFPTQRRSPHNLWAGGRQPPAATTRFPVLPGAPAVLIKPPGCVWVGGLELCLDAVVPLLVILQAADNHGAGAAALCIQRVLFDAILRGGLALAVEVHALVATAHPSVGAPVAGSQVGHAARTGRAQMSRRLVTLSLPGFGGWVLGQRTVVRVGGGWGVVMFWTGVAGARWAVIRDNRAIASCPLWSWQKQVRANSRLCVCLQG